MILYFHLSTFFTKYFNERYIWNKYKENEKVYLKNKTIFIIVMNI